MADSASVLTSKISEKGKLTNSINRTTSESLRLNDSEKVVISPNSLSSTAPRKKTSFQITSVIVGSRTSNDGGDDSADDLDESHAEDISEVLDNSRITDLENETPSYSEDTFSKDDVFFNASSSLVSAPVIPTSSQYGLAIVATPENSESALNPPDSSGNSDTVDTTGGDVTESVINLGVVSTKHDPEMRDMHPPAPRTERFKVVKIESTEPFKRGRWVCMDYLDHNIAQKEQSQVSSAKIESSESNIQVSVVTDIPNSAPSDYTSSVNSVIEVSPLESQVTVPTELINNCPPINMQPNDSSQVSSCQMPLSSVPASVPTSYPSVSPGQSLQNSMQMGHIINSSAPPPQVSQQSQSLSQVNMQQILGNTSQHQSLQSQQMQQILSGNNVLPMQQQQAPIPQTMQQQQPVMQQPMQTMQQMHQTNQQYQPQQQQTMPQQNIQQQQTMPQQQAPMPQQQTIQQSLPQQQQTIPQQQSLPQQQTMPQQTAVSQPQPTLTQQPSLTQQQALQQQAMQQSLPPQPQTMSQQQQTMPQQQPLTQQQSIPPQSQTMPQQQPIPQQTQGISQQQTLSQPQQQQTMPQQQQTLPQQQQTMPQQQQMPQQQSIPQQQQTMPQQQQSMPQQQQPIPQQQTMPQQQQTMAQPQQTMPQQQSIPQQQFQTIQQPQQPMMQQQMPQQTLQTQMPVQQVQLQPGVQQMPIQQTQNQQQQMMQQSLQQMQQPSQMHQVPYSQAMQQTQQPVMTQASGQQQVPGMLPQMHPQMGYQTNQMMPGMQPQPIMNIQSQPHLQPQYYQPTQQMPTGIITSQPGMMTQGGMTQVSMQGSTPNLPPLQTYPTASVPQPMQVQGMPQTPPIPTSVQYTMPHLSQGNQPLSMPMSMQQPMSMPQPQPTPQQQPPLQQPPQPAQSYAGVSSPAQSYTHGMSSSSVPSALMMEHPLLNGEHPENPTAALIESLNEVTATGDEPGEDAESLRSLARALSEVAIEPLPQVSVSTSGANAVAIDNKIEQAMDLVKSHLMYAVREEVEVLKEKIAELMERIGQLEAENATLRAGATPETLAMLPPPSQTTTTNP